MKFSAFLVTQYYGLPVLVWFLYFIAFHQWAALECIPQFMSPFSWLLTFGLLTVFWSEQRCICEQEFLSMGLGVSLRQTQEGTLGIAGLSGISSFSSLDMPQLLLSCCTNYFQQPWVWPSWCGGRVPGAERPAIIILWITALYVLQFGRPVGNDNGLNGSKVCTKVNILSDSFVLQSTLPEDPLLGLTGLLSFKFKTFDFP